MARRTCAFVCGSLLLSPLFGNIAVEPAVAADPIRLNSGYVSLVKLDQTVGTIVIGNPEVVDVALQGKNAILLTAKKVTGSAATNTDRSKRSGQRNIQRHDRCRSTGRHQDRDTQ